MRGGGGAAGPALGRSRTLRDEGQPECCRSCGASPPQGLGFECVSRGEIEHLLASVPDARSRSHPVHAEFRRDAPNMPGRSTQDIQLTIDNVYMLREWGELFRGRGVFIRIDTGTGRGHHHHVRTAGAHAKFGVPMADIDELTRLIARHGVTVAGLHAHSGSGIFDADNWAEVAMRLLDLAQRFPELQAIDVGGGLGVPDGHDQLAAGSGPARHRTACGYGRIARASRCGSSPGATWWLRPARCSRASRRPRPRTMCVTSASRPA